MTKCTKPGQMLMHPCTGTFSSGESCMMLSKYGEFIGCYIDLVCFNASVPTVVGMFERQFQDGESDITGSLEALEAASSCEKAIERLNASTRKIMLYASTGLSYMKPFPRDILYFLSNKI